ELREWGRRTRASIAIGQEIGVTPLQLVMAVSAIANGGWLMRPYVVSEVRFSTGGIVARFEPVVRRHPISTKTAKTLTEISGGARLPADCGAGGSPSGHRAEDGARSDSCSAMRLRECADVLDGVMMQGSLDREITGLTDDSRRVSPGGLFVAVKGTQSDGHRFLAQAVAAGAGAIA